MREIAGKQVDHALAKELLAGFVGGEVDKLAETKGLSGLCELHLIWEKGLLLMCSRYGRI